MADKLIFPIGFDLEKAVNEAGQQWDKKYAKKLEDYINKRPIKVKLDFENLTDVKTRLAQLKIEPITPETKAAIKELARELQVLAKALEQVQKYSSRSAGTAEVRGAKVSEIEAKASAARELARQRAAKAEQAELKLAAAREKSAAAANKATTAVNNLTKAYGNQTYYIERLLKKMVAVWSVQQVQNFLTNIREVTAQFELQRVSLGAIIQDTNKASQLFSEIKTFALKSPVSIMDLTKYTKQVAAYGIETKKLFDTTKMLTDISVGLGTDMSRAVLFFGQVYASNYLRASELRQATELGIPLVDKLAKKLEELNGRGYTAAEVMDLISKRAISFDLVEQVFKDMTSAGGQFYNIQEKQGNTLFGLWAKLGDAASVMYDEIGNTESVNSGMKTAIGLLTELMRNWKAVAKTAQWVIVPNAALLALYKYSTATQRVDAAQSAAAAATERRKAAVLQLSAAIEKGSIDDINAANAALQEAKADEVAAQKATTRMGLLKSGFVSVAKSIGAGLGIGLIIGAVTTLAYKLFEAYENAHRLDRKLDEIDAERITLASQSVRNFEYLADVAVKAADGSKKQKDALDELRRTYKEMIPVQDLTIEHLRQLREGTNNASEAYKSLTTAIREYISEQQKQKKLSAIEEEYGSTITDKYKKLYSELTKGIRINVGGSKIKSWVELQFSPEEFERAMVEFEKRATDKTKSVGQKIKESFAAIGFDLTPDQIKALQKVGKWGEFDDGYFITLNEALEEQSERINAVHTGYAGFVGDLGKYGAEMSRIADVMENKIYKANGKVLESNSFLRKQMQSNEWIKEWTNSLKTNLSSAGIEIKNEWFNFIKSLNPSDPNTISSINFDAILEALNTDAIRKKLGEHYEQTKNYVLAIQKEYQDLVPQNRTVAVLRAKLSSISQATGVSMDKLQHYWMNADESIEDYAKRIKGTIEDLQKTILEMQQVNADKEAMKPGSLLLKGYSEEEIKQANALLLALQQLFAGLKLFTKESGGSGRQSDPRLQNLKEEISLVQKLYNEYKQLEKQEGATKAAADMRRMAGDTLDMFKSKYNIDLPTDAKDLTAALEILYKKMAALPKKVFPSLDKDLKELRWTIEKVDIDESQKQIEAELKRLSDRISRTKTAKEFYEKILGMTGDVELAANVAIHVYGEQGKDLDKQIREQIEKLLEPSGIKIDESIFREDGTFDPKKLREFAEAQKDALGGIESKAYQELIKLSDNADKDFAKTIEGWLKAIEKAKSASDKMLDLARTTRTEIDKITAQKGYAQTRITELLGLGTRTEEQQQELENLQGFLDVADKLIQGFKDKQTKEQTSLAYEMFKDSPMYVQMFDDLGHASTAMLENMKTRIEGLKGAWKDLTPTQLKELQSRMNEIDAQLAKRNPFKTLAKSISDYRKLRREGDSRGNKSEGAANADLMAASKAADEARKKYDELVKKYGEGSEKSVQEVIDAKDKLDRAMANEEAAQKAVENWKKVKDMIGLSANELFQMMDWGADIARGIADISEAMGADEEDVQYWNDVADALGQISGGIQDIVSAAMSGNVVGIISSTLTAIPKMIVGFTNLFSADKIKQANKEIKRQQKLLDQLQYTYSRLERAADKAFGADYINTYRQQLSNLEAQARAYQKQAAAERSKGKDADDDKIKEFDDAYRDTMDQIADMQNQISARMLGADLASTARDFAQAWLDAYKEFGNTADAMSSKFRDMIENMIVESALAKVMERALQPMFDMIDNMGSQDFYSESFWQKVVAKAEQGARDADRGAQTMIRFLEQAGISVRSLNADYSGMAKNISSATSEDINRAAAIGNTLMYYVSPIPRIDNNLGRLLAIIDRGRTPSPATGATGWTDWQQQAMDNYNAIARNTADTVVECRRAAAACEAASEKLGRIIHTQGPVSGVRAFMYDH